MSGWWLFHDELAAGCRGVEDHEVHAERVAFGSIFGSSDQSMFDGVLFRDLTSRLFALRCRRSRAVHDIDSARLAPRSAQGLQRYEVSRATPGSTWDYRFGRRDCRAKNRWC